MCSNKAIGEEFNRSHKCHLAKDAEPLILPFRYEDSVRLISISKLDNFNSLNREIPLIEVTSSLISIINCSSLDDVSNSYSSEIYPG